MPRFPSHVFQGALNTVISSFLVRVRGTREPERSITHSQNLEKFIREVQAFILDEGYSRDRKWDEKVKHFRVEFDKLQTAVHQYVLNTAVFTPRLMVFLLLTGPKMVNQCHNQAFLVSCHPQG